MSHAKAVMRIVLLQMLCLVVGSAAGAEDVSIEKFLPANVHMRGPFNDLSGEFCEYLLNLTSERVAIENRKDGRTIKLDLFKDSKKNGIQREWHPNGKLKSESPYVDGVMHGVFRVWDENGRLIGRYVIEKGNGLCQIYQSDGLLARKVQIKNNEETGLLYYLMEDGRAGLSICKGFGIFGIACDFNPDNTVRFIVSTDERGKLSGPCVEFNDNGREGRVHYNLKDFRVSEEEYMSAAAVDKSLPKYEKDVNGYKKTVPKEYWDLLAEFKALKPVKIPLPDKDDPPGPIPNK